jgi:homoserine O-acetyltransferase
LKTTRTHVSDDFALACGALLPRLVTSYASRGQLDPDGGNAVLVLHGYTTGPAMLFPGSTVAEGSWSDLIGPGLAIDTDRYFVLCPNALGSCYGSSGPSSIDPATGHPYGLDFPAITLDDIVDAQLRLVDALGISKLAAVVGPSLGAMQAFAWAVRHPQRVARIVAAVGAPYNPGILDVPGTLAAVRRAVESPEGVRNFLVRQRIATLEGYGIDADLSTRIPDPLARRQEIERLAMTWANEFDAASLVVLARAIETFDLRPSLSQIQAPLLYVLSRSDPLFPPSLERELAPLFDAAGLRWRYFELDSDKGHLASGADSGLWASVLADFLADGPKAPA